jgi:hypothetical protein
MVGMHVDSDGAFIDNREYYGSSISSSNHSSKDNVESDGISESMSHFELVYETFYVFFYPYDVCMVTRNEH